MESSLTFDNLEVGTMDFYGALKEIVNGSRVRRESWPEGYWIFLSGTLKIHKPDGAHNLIISDADMAATDWMVC